MSSYKQQSRSRVLAHEFWGSDEAFESVNKAGESTPLRSRLVDPRDIRAAKQLFTTSSMQRFLAVHSQGSSFHFCIGGSGKDRRRLVPA